MIDKITSLITLLSSTQLLSEILDAVGKMNKLLLFSSLGLFIIAFYVFVFSKGYNSIYKLPIINRFNIKSSLFCRSMNILGELFSMAYNLILLYTAYTTLWNTNDLKLTQIKNKTTEKYDPIFQNIISGWVFIIFIIIFLANYQNNRDTQVNIRKLIAFFGIDIEQQDHLNEESEQQQNISGNLQQNQQQSSNIQTNRQTGNNTQRNNNRAIILNDTSTLSANVPINVTIDDIINYFQLKGINDLTDDQLQSIFSSLMIHRQSFNNNNNNQAALDQQQFLQDQQFLLEIYSKKLNPLPIYNQLYNNNNNDYYQQQIQNLDDNEDIQSNNSIENQNYELPLINHNRKQTTIIHNRNNSEQFNKRNSVHDLLSLSMQKKLPTFDYQTNKPIMNKDKKLDNVNINDNNNTNVQPIIELKPITIENNNKNTNQSITTPHQQI